MCYNHYNYPSAITEERLVSIVGERVAEGVKDYLSETTEHVKQCHETIAEQQEIIDEKQEIIDEQQETIEALQHRVAELEECLNAIYTGKVSSVKNIYNGCEVTQHYQSEQTHIMNPTFGSMYNVHGNGVVNAG